MHYQENHRWRCVINEVSFHIAEKQHEKAAAAFFHQASTPPLWVAHVHKFFNYNNFEVVPHTSYLPDLAPIMEHFWLFQHWRTLLWLHIFKLFCSYNSDFPVVTTAPLKKCLRQPCNCSISLVKNVYVYWVITLRNDCIFSFIG